ncbi:MAG: site-specific integrase, partial [Planctomycetota bacterium]|nr:site-specific integrase [Planctomycetota bacterium]
MSPLRRRFIEDMTLAGRTEKTIKDYVGAVRRVSKFYLKSPDKITSEELRSWLAHLMVDQGRKWNTIKVYTYGLRFFYHKTLKRPDVELPLPPRRKPKRLPNVLSEEEVVALFEACPCLKHRMIMMTKYACGLRVSEVLHIEVSHIDGNRGVLKVEQGKGRRDRYLPLSESLLKDLRLYWQTHRDERWLFPGGIPGKPLTSSAAQRAYKLAKEKAGIVKEGGIHTLRHTYATHLLERGVDPLRIQRLMGHSTILITLRYLHVSRKHLQETGSPF